MEEQEDNKLIPVAEVENSSLPDMKLLRYWWNVVSEDPQNYEYLDAKIEHLPNNSCKVAFRVVHKETKEEKTHYATIGQNGLVKLSSHSKNEEGEEVEDGKGSFRNFFGSVIYNFIYIFDKFRGKN